MPVYLIRAGESGPVKIGWALDPKERLVTLQCAHHERLSLIKLWEVGRKAEKWLHDRFKHLRIRNEWFVFDPSMLSIEVPDEFPDPLPKKAPTVRTSVLATKVIPAVGSSAELARRLGVNKTAISQWHNRNIPVSRAIAISRITGIPLHELRPDFWRVGERAPNA